MNSPKPASMRRRSAWRWWYRGCLITFAFGLLGICALSTIGAATLLHVV